MADTTDNSSETPRIQADILPGATASLSQATLDGIHDIVCVFGAGNRLIMCNRAGHEFFGLSPDDIPGISRDTLFRACQIASCDDAVISSVMQQTPGDILWFHAKSRYMRSSRSTASVGERTGDLIVEQLTDITDFIHALHAGREHDLQYRQLVDTMPFGLVIVQEGRIVLANDRLCGRYGVDRDALEGAALQAYLGMVHADDRDMITTAMQPSGKFCCKTGCYEFRRISPPDDQGWCEMHISRIIYGGKPACQGILRDTSSTRLTAKALHDTNMLLKAIFNGARDPIFAKDRSLTFTHANPAVEKVAQTSVDELIGRTEEEVFGVEAKNRSRETDLAVLDGEIRTVEESFMIGGQEHTFQTAKVPIRDDQGDIIGLCGIAHDITELKSTLTELKHSRRKYKRIFERFRDVYYETDLEGTILEISPSIELFSKYRREDLIGTSVVDLYQDPGTRETLLAELRQRGRIDDFELTLLDADGVSMECSANMVLTSDPEDGEACIIIGSIRNIGGLKRVERALSTSLREKEVLLREIHHRLKNNLQVISGLLTLQAQRTTDTAYQHLLAESISRVNSMSLIHESLYQSPTLSDIDMQHYLTRLTRHLIALYRGDSDNVSVFIDTTGISLSMDRAIPCGFIINELVSNALKHGFSENAEGSILITMSLQSGNTIILVVSHTGMGFADTINWRELPSLGLQLVVMLTEHQLRGAIELTAPERSEFTITFQR